MRYKRVLLGVVVASALALAGVVSWAVVGPSRAAPPDEGGITVPYAGRLNDTQGEPVADGTYDFSFGLYADETGGKALWQETQPGVPVADGSFSVQLGSAAAIPEGALGGDGAWLAVAVRGPGEVEFTDLAPRQPVRAAAATDSDISAAATCPHDHFGETWSGTRNWSQGAFIVANGGNGPSVWGRNTGGGNAVRGDGYGTGAIGVYGEADGADGVAGSSAADTKSGVFGHSTYNAFGGYGVYGISDYGRGIQGEDGGPNPDDSYAIYSLGDMKTTDDLTVQDALTVGGLATFNGGKSGYVVDIARNDGTVSLEAGDVVVISGAGPAVVGEIPVIKVRRAMAAGTSAVVGVVDKLYVPSQKVEATSGREAKAESAVESADIAPGEYMTVVTLGAYEAIKVDAAYGAIAPGDLLVASPNAGYAMRAASPAPGSVIGKALGALASGSGAIPVIITLQ